MRRASKSDANQPEIVKELRELGFDVDVVSREKRLYDVVVSGIAAWAPCPVGLRVEIKVNDKAPLTRCELEYWREQHHDNLIRATCVEDVLRWFGK
jgi:hypothetical protein